NLVGYLSAETGMGEAARSLAHSLELAGIPHSLHDLELGVVARREDPTYAGATTDFPYDVNLFVANADQVPHVRDHLGPGAFAGRYNIGYWLWEQEAFPRGYWPAFEALDEVWTASSFCVDAISGPSPIPVRRVPLAVRPRPEDPAGAASRSRDRESLGFAEGVFVFAFLFNYLSHFERKNPLAAVRAFRRAFGDDPRRLLLLKTSQRDHAPEKAAMLEAAAEGVPNIRIVDAYWPRERVHALFTAADAYVSLHRSEGFGLTLAEAMWHRMPVVATDYSGSRDFFGPSTGFPVRWTYTPVREAGSPYPEGSRWAEADEAHAAEQMRRVAEDREARKAAVEGAADWVRRELTPEAVAAVLRRRFDELLERHASLPAAGLGQG
ncbi:MAG: glycosyltransferase, partial [Holophagales bacterium]|nr:glycosyltransferase [Holophagales bacterium]